jgi:hypothetical protein
LTFLSSSTSDSVSSSSDDIPEIEDSSSLNSLTGRGFLAGSSSSMRELVLWVKKMMNLHLGVLAMTRMRQEDHLALQRRLIKGRL